MSNTTLADGYRWLRLGEILEPTDEFSSGSTNVLWEPTCASGKFVLCENIYRRKLPLPSTPIPRPPLGLTPRNIWIETCKSSRKSEVVDAIRRYLEANLAVPAAWLEELIDLTINK